MEDQEGKVIETTVKFTWTIKNFSKLHSERLYSDTFFSASIPWRILVFPKAANNGQGLSIHLTVGNNDNFPLVCANFKLSLVNQIDAKMSITHGTKFKAVACARGFEFLTSDEFRCASIGFLVNDTCRIVAEVFVVNSAHHKDTNVNHSPNIIPSYGGELVDFKGLCKLEKDFAQLLEKVCSKHPGIIQSHGKRNRSQRFVEWSFTALGRVLHFLKTKKVKDMHDDWCNKELQNLWEELQSFGFDDLSWLEPHVQSALGIKSYMERASQVKKLKGNVDDLEAEIKGMKAKIDAAQAKLEIAKKELVKAQEGFVKRELNNDVELGYLIIP